MNSNIKKRNKSLNRYLGSHKEKQKLIKTSLKSNYDSNKEFDNFQSTITNIAKQLNNISLKTFSQTKTNINIFSEKKSHLENINNDNNNKKANKIQILKIINNNSFIIKRTSLNSNENNNEENEIKKENENLKENIKFLLGQIKRYQKCGIIIEEDSKNNLNDIIEKDNEIKKLKNEILHNKKRISFLEEENKNIKEKYDDLKIKYNTNYYNNTNSSNTGLDENKLYQYNSKKNNTYYYNFENTKNNLENYNYNQKKFTFHKTHHTTDFSHNYLSKNYFSDNNISKEATEKNNILIQQKKAPKKMKNIKYLSLITSANKNLQNKDIYYYPKSTKAYSTNSFLYKKNQIKGNVNKSSIGQNMNYNYFKMKNSNFNLHKKNKKCSAILYHKKSNNLSISYNPYNPNANLNNMYIQTTTRSYSSKISFNEDLIPLPKLDTSPNDLYFFSNLKNDVYLYDFKISEMKFSIIKYLLLENSSFKYYYDSTINHSYDILLSISNGFFLITGPNTNYLYFYNKEKNIIYDLNKLNKSHNKGALVQINNEKVMCLSGIKTTEVEMYYIKDNIWVNLPKMNCSHSESSYFIYNSSIIFSFFGYDYENNKYINDIEYIYIKRYYNEKIWNKIDIKDNSEFNLRSHSIFYRINKEKKEKNEIFIVGGYNNCGRNNGLIQIFIDNNDLQFNINFKKYEENKVKLKENSKNLDKHNNKENLFLFQNGFYQYFDEEDNLLYNYNCDSNFNIHIIDNFTLKHTIYKNKLNN